MKCVLRFIAGTLSHGIYLRRMVDNGVLAYCDAEWGGDVTDRKSRTGFLVYVGGMLVSWSSRKQAMVALSTTKAEYQAIATTTQELEAVRTSLLELGVKVPFPMMIFMDNLEASFIARNPIAHIFLKHVAIDLHFIREQIEKGELVIDHIPEAHQWADILTKALPPKTFITLQGKLVSDISTDCGGACCTSQHN